MADSSQPGWSTYAKEDECRRYIPLYKAALQGDWESAERFFNRDKSGLTARVNKLRETALHVSVGVGSKSINFVKNLIANMPVEALEIQDHLSATALHIAAWVGNLEAAKALVERHPRLIYMRDVRSWLPFHLAAFNAHKDTLSYLVDLHKFDPMSQLFNNEDSGACFLVHSIVSGFYDVALDFVKKYPTLATSKQDNGNYGLKAMARKASAFPSACQHNFWQRIIYAHVPVKLDDCIIYQNEGDIENPVDNSQVIVQKYNWARVLMQYLSIAVPCIKNIQEQKKMHIQALELVKRLCTTIRSLNYSNTYDLLPKDALHVAAREGIREVIEELVESFPSLVWAHDSEGHNLFQRAVIERHENVFNLLYQMSDHRQSIIQHIDESRNNLLHFAGRQAPPKKLSLISGAALQMQRELQWFKQVEKFSNPSDIEWQNDADETPKAVFTKEHRKLVVDGDKWMKDTANSCTIPAILIATVVFAAAITVPGGNNSADGLPIFSNEVAFTIFLVFDAISLFTSTTSLLMFLSILTSRCAEDDFLFVLPNRLIIGLVSLFLSITTMVVAFSSSLYLVLVFAHNDPWIIIPVVALASLPIISFASLQFPLVMNLIASTYGRGIFGKQSDRPFY